NGDKEIDHKHYLRRKGKKGDPGNKFIQPLELIERNPGGKVEIPPRHPRQPFIIHWPKDQVRRRQRDPEMDIAQEGMHIPAEELREPMIDGRKHSEHRRNPHHEVKMCDDEIGVMQLNVQCTIPYINARKAAGNERAYKPYCEKHPRCKPDIPPP